MPSSQQVRIPETLESQNPGIRVALWQATPYIQIQIQPDRLRDVRTVLISTVRRDLVHFPVPISGLLHRLT